MAGYAHSVLTAFDYVVGRLRARLAGLGDDEFFWEPVADCWSLRAGPDGAWHLEEATGATSSPEPVTTIAWRFNHLASDALGGFTRMRFPQVPTRYPAGTYATSAAEVSQFLDVNYTAWRGGLEGLDGAGWESPLGESWGPYAKDNTIDLALHVLDEVIHHAAEVALLRDLYAKRVAPAASRASTPTR